MNVEIEQELYDSLKREADRKKISISAVIANLASQLFGKNKPKEKSLEEQLKAVVKSKNYPLRLIETNEKGELIIDKEKYPELYDWAVNG